MKCVYCLFEGKDLAPANEATRARMSSLQLDKYDFDGKSVLDIGANSGLLSLTLASRGAFVFSLDIQKTLIDELNIFLKENKIGNVVTSNFDFMQLDRSRKYDFVFFLEVLHWSVYQGYSIDSVLEKLADLTSGTLFLEFPWDTLEPAIVNQTSLTEEVYSSYLIFRKLTDLFENVRIVRFQKYFDDKNSKRVLVVCSENTNPD